MISRVYVASKAGLSYINCYTISHKFSHQKLVQIANALTNPILEQFSINKMPQVGKFHYAVEIGFKPGVTDNVAHTVKETIIDLLHLKNTKGLEIYTSKIYFKPQPYNPLIERAYINNKGNFPNKVPKVVLKKQTSVKTINLNVVDEGLERISKEGVLALDLASMKAIQAHFSKLKRNPTDIELESLAQTWSEHCKHTIFASPIDDISEGLYKTYIKGATNLIRKNKGAKDFCVSVFSDNAGGIIFDKDYLITHKVETHNTPSLLDPFGGAMTGIVGVNRDTIGFGLGGKPVANTYGFCLGEPEDKRPLFLDKENKQRMLLPERIMKGVIKGVNVGGNCSGIPTLSGFIKFDERYRGKPLIFAGTVGLIPRKIGGKLSHIKSARAGDYVVMVGGRVGADGIHGATFSSVALDVNSPATAVQIGDPITQKKFSDAIIKEARDMNLYNSITDNGAGGLSCSVAEMAKECGGAKVFIEKIPLKYPGLRPWEIWISESQERMTLAVPKKNWKKFQKLMESRGVEATVIGEFTNSGKCIVMHKGKKIMDLDMEFLHNGLPKHHLTTSSVNPTHTEPKIISKADYSKTLENLLNDKNVSGFSFISKQYDHEVQASSVLKPTSGRGMINTDAQVFKPVLSSNKGVALSSALYPSYGDISAYHMAACALDTAIRNIVCAGGTLSHLAILDNFCWCSSNDKVRLGELVDTVKACYDYAVGYGTPFISGKDSMFNDFKGFDEKGNPVNISIPPTLLISAIGVMQDIYKTVSPEFKNVGDVIYLLGETNNELDVPKVNLEKNLQTYLALEKAIQKELVSSALSITLGGLGVALSKASIGGMLGCEVNIKNLAGNASTSYTKLFSESQGRVLISVSPKNLKAFEKIMKNISYTKLGKTIKNGKLIIFDKNKVIDTKVKNLYSAYHKFSNKQS